MEIRSIRPSKALLKTVVVGPLLPVDPQQLCKSSTLHFGPSQSEPVAAFQKDVTPAQNWTFHR
jgi:hypothetical protein